MAVDVTLQDVQSGYQTDVINNNFQAIETALTDAVSRSNTAPNQMSGDLDLNSHKLLNASEVDTLLLKVGGISIASGALAVGPMGNNGWSPVFAIVTDSARRVLQLKSYVGGQGTPPTDNINFYVGSTGMTSVLANGVDIRGAAGAGSGDMTVAVYDAAGVGGQLVNTTATQNLSGKTLTSGSLGSAVTAVTASPGDNDTSIATTAFVTDATTKETTQNSQTGTTYTLALTDAGGFVEITNASGITLTVPPNSSVAFPLKTRIDIVQQGAGQISVAAGAGVTIRSSGSKLKLTGQYSGATLLKRATDEWYLIGDIST